MFTLKELAALTAATLIGDPELLISGINTLEEALSTDASFLANPNYGEAMKRSSAGVICIDPQTPPVPGKNYLVSANPSLTFQLIAEKLIPSACSGFTGIHPTAVIHPSAKSAHTSRSAPTS